MKSITVKLDMIADRDPREIGDYLVLDENYNIGLARWDGERFEVDDLGHVVAWMHTFRPATLSATEEKKLIKITEARGDFNTYGDYSEE